ncbi:interferon alpha-inducible protein 27-like protein 2A [Falco naumanni]|uniref:interferon alpha-inducible protein 27-like protein 2A n=1 Tax=Falco naumanni TaxID=148594 RepID=UPI001ADE2D60|nr:interferon alpha-inducible protein 27-like protein 2A [Falco naumanni]
MKNEVKRAAIGATVGVGAALLGVPAVISVLGFKATGIAAGSLAAKMMSAAAIANNGAVSAGSTVAVLQSIGAGGFSLGAKIGLMSTLGPLGAVAGSRLFNWKKNSDDKPK